MVAPVGGVLEAQIETLFEGLPVVDTQRAIVGFLGWVQLFGMISFELFGTFNNVFDQPDELYAHQADLVAQAIGLQI